jgi:uncharacterized protein DUF5985
MTLMAFLQGAIAMGCAAAGLFFLKFWHQSRDRLFVQFALAFWILAMSYATLTLLSSASEWRVSVFVLRLLAFCLILYAIFDKNRR